MKDVAVILVGMNAREFVLGCLQSLEKAEWREVTYSVIYIDNGSVDGSVEAVKEGFSQVQVLANAENTGYCPAANQGTASIDARYYYFINDDTLVLNDAIALTVEYMDAHPDVGTVGSRLIYPDGSEQYSGRLFPSFWSGVLGRQSLLTRLLPNAAPVADYLCKKQLNQSIPFDVDWVSAAGQIVRKETFEAVGRYAEDYYYWHEAVFCHRITELGQRVVLHPESRIVHYEGKGSGPRPRKTQQFHVINFHQGAFRCYCERYQLSPLNPVYWLVGSALASRGALLWCWTYLQPQPATAEA